jgi:hypothetical protein
VLAAEVAPEREPLGALGRGEGVAVLGVGLRALALGEVAHEGLERGRPELGVGVAALPLQEALDEGEPLALAPELDEVVGVGLSALDPLHVNEAVLDPARARLRDPRSRAQGAPEREGERDAARDPRALPAPELTAGHDDSRGIYRTEAGLSVRGSVALRASAVDASGRACSNPAHRQEEAMGQAHKIRTKLKRKKRYNKRVKERAKAAAKGGAKKGK